MKLIQEYYHKLPRFIRNKYLLVSLGAAIWFLFFDPNTLFQQFRYSREINKLNNDKEYYEQQIINDSLAVDRLQNDPAELERYAREQYLMKKKGEDIFIVPEE